MVLCWRRYGRAGGCQILWGCSSVGRAPALQAGGQEFESLHLHSVRKNRFYNPDRKVRHRTLKTAYRTNIRSTMKRMIGWLPFTGVGRLRTKDCEWKTVVTFEECNERANSKNSRVPVSSYSLLINKTSEKNRKGSVRRCNAMHRSGSPRNRKKDKAKKSAGWMPWH